MDSADPPGWRGTTIALAGRCCRILVDDPAWLGYLSEACGRYETARAAEARLYLAGRSDGLPEVPRALLARARDAGGPPPWVEQRDGWTTSTEARKWLVVGPELAVCWARQPIASPASFYYNYLHPLLIEWLARSGVLYLHAGAVDHPATGPLLIVGPRHAGKTTTCLALVAAGGCRLLSDDTVLLDDDGHAHTLLRAMHPERRLCEAWASQLGIDRGVDRGIDGGLDGGLDTLPVLDDDRLDLDPARWFTDRLVARIDAPRTLLLPWAAGDEVTRCEPVGPEQAAAVVLAQLHAGVPPIAPAQLHRIAALLALPALRVHIGRDAFADPAVLWRAVRGALEPRS